MSGKPAKKTKEQIAAEKAAVEAALEAERKAAEERAELERKKREEEEALARAVAAQRRLEELQRLETEYTEELQLIEAIKTQHSDLVKHAKEDRQWQAFKSGARTDAGTNLDTSLGSFISQMKEADKMAIERVLEGTGSLLAPPTLLGLPTYQLSPTVTPVSSRVLAHEAFATCAITEEDLAIKKANMVSLSSPTGAFGGMGARTASGMFSVGSATAISSSLPVSVGVGVRAPGICDTGVPPVRLHDEVVSALSPGMAACTALATVADDAERALADAIEDADTYTAEALIGYLTEMRHLAQRRVDAVSSELMQASSEYGIELKDAVRELHSFAHFDVAPLRTDTLSATQLPNLNPTEAANTGRRRGFAVPRVAADLMLWANVGTAKVLRTKTIRNALSKEKIAAKDADANATICIDLHKQIASMHAAIRVLRTDYDFAAISADFIAAQESDILKSEGVIPEDLQSGGTGAATNRTSRTGRSSSARTSRAGPGTTRRSSLKTVQKAAETEAEEAADSKTDEEKKEDKDEEGKEDKDEEGEEDDESLGPSSTERKAISGRTGRAGAASDEDANFTVAEAEKVLQAMSLQPLGGVLHVDLLSLPQFPLVSKGWMMTKYVSAVQPHFQVQRISHPAVGQGASASAQAIKLRVRIPEHILMPPEGRRQVARWMRFSSSHPLTPFYTAAASSDLSEVVFPGDLAVDARQGPQIVRTAAATAAFILAQVATTPAEEKSAVDTKGDKTAAINALAGAHACLVAAAGASPGYWRADDTLELTYDETSRVLTFATLHMAPHALVLPRHFDLPYKSWSITPVYHPADIVKFRTRLSNSRRSAALTAASEALAEAKTAEEVDQEEMAAALLSTSRNAAVLRLELERFTLAIMINDDGTARLVGPTNVPELRWLIGTDVLTGADAVVVPPSQLLHLLARSGVWLIPADVDLPLLNLHRQSTMSSAAAAASVAETEQQVEAEQESKPKSGSNVAFAVPDESEGKEDAEEKAPAPLETAADKAASLPVLLPVALKNHVLEQFVYGDIARLAGAFSFCSSKWNGHPSVATEKSVVRGSEVLLNPLLPGNPASLQQAEEHLLGAASGATEASMDPTRWRMIEHVADPEAASSVRVMLVQDTEAAAALAWESTIDTARKSYYADLLAPQKELKEAEEVVGADGMPANAGAGVAPASARPVTAPSKSSTGPSFIGKLEDGMQTHTAARLALVPRASEEAMDLVQNTSAVFIAAVEKLLRLVRPLSFAQ